MEPIAVILQTYKRTDYALRTIEAACEHLRYDGDLWWYVADDGSPAEHLEAIYAAMGDLNLSRVFGHTERRGYGGNANLAWAAASRLSALTFWLEDDFMLSAPLDLTPHAYTLMDYPAIGMVRLGYIDPERLGKVVDCGGRDYYTLPRDWPDTSFYAFTGHPSLRHVRYREVYGSYPEGLGPGDTELAYAYQYRMGPADGPRIVWPVDYPAGGLFHHIGEIKSETLL